MLVGLTDANWGDNTFYVFDLDRGEGAGWVGRFSSLEYVQIFMLDIFFFFIVGEGVVW